MLGGVMFGQINTILSAKTMHPNVTCTYTAIYIVLQFAKLFSPTTYDEVIRQILTMPNNPVILS